jgi:hypothetical protein
MSTEQADIESPELDDPGSQDDAEAAALPEMPLGVVLARILVVTAMSFSAAVAIFSAVGAIWLITGISVALTILFLALMFGIERLAER